MAGGLLPDDKMNDPFYGAKPECPVVSTGRARVSCRQFLCAWWNREARRCGILPGALTTLERIQTRADKLFPGKLLLTQEEAALILGVEVDALQTRGIIPEYLTCEELARLFSFYP